MLENIDELPFIAQAAVSVLVFALALLVTRVIVLRTFLRIVRSTEAEWDDMLYRPVSNRLYILVSVGVIQYILSFIDLGESAMEQETQIFSAIYILLGASFLSVSVQHLMPVIKDRFFSKSNVTVKGSNSLIIFSLRALLWFIGIFFALEELEEEEFTMEMIDVGAEDIEFEEDTVVVSCEMEDFGNISKRLQEMDLEPKEAGLKRIPITTKEINQKDYPKFEKLIDVIEDDDDVQKVYHNVVMKEG